MAYNLKQTDDLAKAVIRDYIETIAKKVVGKIDEVDVSGSVEEINFFDKGTEKEDLGLVQSSGIIVDNAKRSNAVEIVGRRYKSGESIDYRVQRLAEEVYKKIDSELSGVANRCDADVSRNGKSGSFVFLSEKDWIGMAADIMGISRSGVKAAMEQFEAEKSTDVAIFYR